MSLSIFVFADLINCNIEFRRYANQDGRWYVAFEDSEISEPGILVSRYGTGKSMIDALENYVQQIKGQTLVLNSGTDRRQQYTVPEYLIIG